MSRQMLVWEGTVSLWKDDNCYRSEWEADIGERPDEEGRIDIETVRIVGMGMTPLQAVVSLFSELMERGIVIGPVGGMDSL